MTNSNGYGPRLCVFCGKNPTNKNSEHVLPEWLAKFTGKENRLTDSGLDYLTGKKKPIPADGYEMPSCESCNNSMSAWEDKVKHVVKKIDERSSITADEARLFLDWLDKVRTGLWLFRVNLSKNIFGISPNFRIFERMAAKDRMVVIYPYIKHSKGLNFFGIDSPIFSTMPSCFGIRINSFFCISISSDFFLSLGKGLPYPWDNPSSEGFPNGCLSLGFGSNIFTLPLKFYKPSMMYGEILHNNSIVEVNEIYSKIPKPFRVGNNSLNYFGLMDFQNQKSELSDNLNVIEFGSINASEAVQAQKLAQQVYTAQKNILLNYPAKILKRDEKLKLYAEYLKKMEIENQ